MLKVLCLCRGNTCRSPMMERMLKDELETWDICDAHIESAGLMESAAGQPMAEFSMNELRRRTINCEDHVSRFVGTIDLSSFDIVLTVGETEAEQIRHFPGCPETVVVLNGENGGIPNPWEQGENAYRDCAVTIAQSIARFAATLY